MYIYRTPKLEPDDLGLHNTGLPIFLEKSNARLSKLDTLIADQEKRNQFKILHINQWFEIYWTNFMVIISSNKNKN